MKNQTIYRAIVVVGVAVTCVTSLLYFVYRRIDVGIADSVQHKSAKRTTATVVSVAHISSSAKPPAPERPEYTICFGIDSFDNVEPTMRQGYETAETNRYLREGPRCKRTIQETIAARLRVGDKLEVVYLLENEYKIDIVSVTAYGREL